MADELNTKRIWKSISSAIGAEIREATSIQGRSGQDHPVQAIAVDDKTNRVVIFSAEPSPRIAALMQGDVQATLPDAHVLVARPVIFDLSAIAHRVAKSGGLDVQALFRGHDAKNEMPKTIAERIGPIIKPLFETASKVPLPISVQLMDVIEQAKNLHWKSADPSAPTIADFLDVLLSATTLDSAAVDRQLGICPIPLYEFSEPDYELLLSGKRIEEVRVRLKTLGVYQYFFPAPDQLLLGLVDNKVTKDGSLVLAGEQAPSHGHPFGEPELFQNTTSLVDAFEELKGAGYVADAEIGYEITEKGRIVRQSVKIRPREGLISKISKIISVKVDLSLKDILK